MHEGFPRDQEMTDDFLWWEDPRIPRLCMMMADAWVPVRVKGWDVLAGVTCKYDLVYCFRCMIFWAACMENDVRHRHCYVR